MTTSTQKTNHLTLVSGELPASMESERQPVLTTLRLLLTLRQKYGNKQWYKNLENGVGGERHKNSCKSLGMCQGDGRCTDCQMKG